LYTAETRAKKNVLRGGPSTRNGYFAHGRSKMIRSRGVSTKKSGGEKISSKASGSGKGREES